MIVPIHEVLWQNEEELDLFCSCIRANISIMLHKTIYEISSIYIYIYIYKGTSNKM